MTELEQQQTEVIREMEFERALLEGEHKTEREALAEEEEALKAVRLKEAQLLERAAEAKQVRARREMLNKCDVVFVDAECTVRLFVSSVGMKAGAIRLKSPR